MTNQDEQDITGMLAAWNDGDANAPLEAPLGKNSLSITLFGPGSRN